MLMALIEGSESWFAGIVLFAQENNTTPYFNMQDC
ncbi:hypothetical protein JOD20_001671 [Herpetosiphon giganteus]|nr:hypothetical protein [Herpetosiphon giganteus]